MMKHLGLPALAFLFLARAAGAATITVSSAGDGDTPDGACTLREAIVNANDDAATSVDCVAGDGFDLITFAAPMTIRPATPLPAVTAAAVLLAGGQSVTIDGSLMPDGGNGLVLTGGQSTVQGLTITGFQSGAGIVLRTNGGNSVGTNVLTGNAIGIDVTSGGNVIGGSQPAANVVTRNTVAGIVVDGMGNSILANYVGTDAAGAGAGNGDAGIQVGGGFTIVGAPGAGNIVSGNLGVGIRIRGGNSLVRGNWIGVGADDVPLPNRSHGILIDAANATVGGATPDDANVIAANGVGSPAGGWGVVVGQHAVNAVVQGNRIGTTASGRALPNALGGILATDGGRGTLQANLIADQATVAVQLQGGSSLFAHENCIVRNGLGVAAEAGSSADFRGNWWGDASGPSGAGPGSGNSISAGVDFAPWSAAPPAGCIDLLVPGELAQCLASEASLQAQLTTAQSELAAAQSQVLSLTADLAAARAALDDADDDGVLDPADRCPGTAAGAVVDAMGCTRAEFCAGFAVATLVDSARCELADFDSDQPSGWPLDCKVAGSPRHRRCVAR